MAAVAAWRFGIANLLVNLALGGVHAVLRYAWSESLKNISLHTTDAINNGLKPAFGIAASHHVITMCASSDIHFVVACCAARYGLPFLLDLVWISAFRVFKISSCSFLGNCVDDGC